MTTATLPKRHKDRGMEGRVAKWYASNTGKSMDDFVKLARRVANQVPSGGAVLEVAPGPGYFCVELAKLGPYAIAGIDISHTFVEIGRKNAADAGIQVEFRQGNASSLPFADGSFDFLLCRAAFKNFAEPVRALQEMCRVLKPGGRGLIIDLSRDASPESIQQHVQSLGLNAWNRMVTKIIFKTLLLRSAYSRKQFEQMLAQTKFRNVDMQEVEGVLEILMTK